LDVLVLRPILIIFGSANGGCECLEFIRIEKPVLEDLVVGVASSQKCRILEEDGPQEVHQAQKPNLAEPFIQIAGILPAAGEAFLHLRENSSSAWPGA
jgi:hypothetical protein